MAKPMPNVLWNLVGAAGAELLKNAFAPCKIQGCTAHSLGIVCKACSRTLCQSHAYMTVPVPGRMAPEPICASCIMENHRELWAEDPMVIEAEVVDE